MPLSRPSPSVFPCGQTVAAPDGAFRRGRKFELSLCDDLVFSKSQAEALTVHKCGIVHVLFVFSRSASWRFNVMLHIIELFSHSE